MKLYERERHLEALEDWRREAAANGRLVFVGGEAGVGKTALVDHFCQLAQGRARVVRGACDPLSTPRPLGPLLDFAAATGGELDRLLNEGAPRDRLFRALLTELSAGVMPALAVIEDAHWADQATIDLLRFLGRRMDGTRAMLVVTYRDDEVVPNHPLRVILGDLATASSVRRLSLAPLSEAGIRSLAEGSGLDPASLHLRTGGNPFFASEVLGDRGTTGGIPATVRDAVLARSFRLALDGRDALDAAAVIGSPIDSGLLIDVAGATAEAVEGCLASGMLVAIGNRALAFRHELARSAIYDSISPPRRGALHARVLAALQSRPAPARDLALLAHHAEASGDRNAVLTYAPAAALKASALGANREATAQYARALRFSSGLPAEQRLALLESYADASDLAGSGAAGVTMRKEMIGLAHQIGNPLKEADHFGWLADSLAIDGQYRDAIRAADAALAVLSDIPEGAAHAQAYYHQAHARNLMGDVEAAVLWGERAIDLSTLVGDDRTLLLALNAVGETRLTGGEEAHGCADLERCLEIAKTSELGGFAAAAMANLGSGYAEIGCFSSAEAHLVDAIAFASEREDDNWRDWGVAWFALTRMFQGRWVEAEELAASVLNRPSVGFGGETAPGSTSFGVPAYVRIVALLAMGRVCARRGDLRAGAFLDEALELTGRDGSFRRRAPIRAARAELAWLSGDRDRAAVELHAALNGSVGYRHAWLEGELAIGFWRIGEAATTPDRLSEPFSLQIKGDWAGASAAWEALGCPYEAAISLLEGDERSIRRALTTFERLGARPAAAIAVQRLRALGVRAIPRGPRPATRANPANLTARELEIVPMLTAGKRNADIAAGLFLSPKTVEHHVRSIIAKLGVESRSEIARAVERLTPPVES